MSQITESIPPEEYTPDKGKFIAEGFAKGDALRDICEHSNGWLPAMLYVRRWRSMFPAFDALMIEAGACRAENMAEDMINISDDTSQQAAHNRNRLNTREKLAGWLAPREYGTGKQFNDVSDGDQVPIYMLTDDQLLAIAAGNLAPAIEGECEVVEGEGVHPPLEHEPPAEYEVSGTKKPRSTSGEHSVTTNDCKHRYSLKDGVCEFCGAVNKYHKYIDPDVEFREIEELKKISANADTELPVRSFVGME